MALAIRLERLVEEGRVQDYAEIAQLGHVSRARLTQIMNLRQLAPDIQEQILFLPLVLQGKDPITDRALRPIAAELDWEEQRGMWGASQGGSKDEQGLRAPLHARVVLKRVWSDATPLPEERAITWRARDGIRVHTLSCLQGEQSIQWNRPARIAAAAWGLGHQRTMNE